MYSLLDYSKIKHFGLSVSSFKSVVVVVVVVKFTSDHRNLNDIFFSSFSVDDDVITRRPFGSLSPVLKLHHSFFVTRKTGIVTGTLRTDRVPIPMFVRRKFFFLKLFHLVEGDDADVTGWRTVQRMTRSAWNGLSWNESERWFLIKFNFRLL